MDEPLKCPHGADVYPLPNGEPYFPNPCHACEADAVAIAERGGALPMRPLVAA